MRLILMPWPSFTLARLTDACEGSRIVSSLIHWLTLVLPPTIHPMVVHFPIALLWTTAVVDILAVLVRGRDHFLDRAGFWLLTGSGASIFVAAAAGVISEQSVHLTPTTAAILSAHQRDAVLTGLFALAGWLVQIATRFRAPERGAWSLFGSGRGRVSGLVMLFVIGAAVMVSITGTLGGSMVYDHCLGVPAVACRTAPR
jgi:uncharacterized membrane protein